MMLRWATAARGSVSHSISVVKRRNKSLRVDIHCHYLNPEAAAKVAPLNPAQHEAQVKFANAMTREVNVKQHKDRAAMLSSIDLRLKAMDRMGIDIPAASPPPNQPYHCT